MEVLMNNNVYTNAPAILQEKGLATEREKPVAFPVGYHRFHKSQVYNFQLNRWYSLGFFRYLDIALIGERIAAFADWKTEMLKLAEKAQAENRLMNAAFYYRAAEFYTLNQDEPGKEFYYDRFANLFYQAIAGEQYERLTVPYASGYLPVLHIAPQGAKIGTLVLHGGFDSFIEEWYYVLKYFAMQGFDVFGFEGPGQGHVILKQGIALDYQWEKPVKAVLDAMGIQEAALFGLSMGGWFCLRAAAFEPRIRQVIASGHAVDYSRIPPEFARWLMMFFVTRYRDATARSFQSILDKGKSDMQNWQTSNLAHITKLPPLEAFEYSLNLNQENLHCEKITQHVLYLTGRDDHIVPFKMHEKQVQLFTHAASLTDRVFTKGEQAQNHCQIGNIPLMLGVVSDWLKEKQGKRS
jgi:pimeloyl-ACP methyl ester carboxylesterase